MRVLKLLEKLKGTQLHALGSVDKFFNNTSKPSKSRLSTSDPIAHSVLPLGLLQPELLEPDIDPFLKPIDVVVALADLYRRLDDCIDSDRSLIYLEQYSVLLALGDDKLLGRCLGAARQCATDVYSIVVLSAWLRFEHKDDEISSSPLEFLTNLVSDQVRSSPLRRPDEPCGSEGCDIAFCIYGEAVQCIRSKIAALSPPLESMLYGGFSESKTDSIDFSGNELSLEGMQALEIYSRRKKLDLFSSKIVLELLVFANRFCCEELKSFCDTHLASTITGIEDALLLFHYGIDHSAHLLVASCLLVFLWELPKSLYNEEILKLFCNSIASDRLVILGRAGFSLYYFLSKVAMEEMLSANTTVMLLQKLRNFATEKWQRSLASHLLGCVLLEMKQFKEAQLFFEAAAEEGHVYSLAGVARSKLKQGKKSSAFRLINSLIFNHKPLGWMYQERSFYGDEQSKLADLITATKLDPTLTFPYKYRAAMKAEAKQLEEAIAELDKIIRFKVSADLLELRAWFSLAKNDHSTATRDARAIVALEPNYSMCYGKMRIDHFITLVCSQIPNRSISDCWIQLHEHWSSVDDIGSLAVIHQMLATNPRHSGLHFRQSLLLLRLNCQRAAINSLLQARNNSSSEHERLVYEGWIAYNNGHREKALSKAEQSLSLVRSFEAYFLKSYALTESASSVIHLLEEALTCHSDGLRKGQALYNLGSIYLDCNRLNQAADCFRNALVMKHTIAHQGQARLYNCTNQKKSAYDEMCKLIGIAEFSAAAYEKRAEYCDPSTAIEDLNMATKLNPLRTYPYRYRAAVLMDNGREREAVEELSRVIRFKPDVQLLHLRAAFFESMGDYLCAARDCEAALCIDCNHVDTIDVYARTKKQIGNGFK